MIYVVLETDKDYNLGLHGFYGSVDTAKLGLEAVVGDYYDKLAAKIGKENIEYNFYEQSWEAEVIADGYYKKAEIIPTDLLDYRLNKLIDLADKFKEDIKEEINSYFYDGELL